MFSRRIEGLTLVEVAIAATVMAAAVAFFVIAYQTRIAPELAKEWAKEQPQRVFKMDAEPAENPKIRGMEPWQLDVTITNTSRYQVPFEVDYDQYILVSEDGRLERLFPIIEDWKVVVPLKPGQSHRLSFGSLVDITNGRVLLVPSAWTSEVRPFIDSPANVPRTWRAFTKEGNYLLSEPIAPGTNGASQND